MVPRHLERSCQCHNFGQTPYSVHQWIGNWILPYFDHNTSSLGFLEAEITPKNPMTNTKTKKLYNKTEVVTEILFSSVKKYRNTNYGNTKIQSTELQECKYKFKKPTYCRYWLSQPMRIVAPIAKQAEMDKNDFYFFFQESVLGVYLIFIF